MADNVIGDYDAAVSIDGSTNYLLIQPGSASTAYKKINRETLLGVTGQPADISTAQSVTNKTLDNTNIATLRDDRLTLQDSGDVTKQATFQLSGITAGQTRVMTLPDASTTLVGTGATQTLTNKTLTSPAITGGTLANSTITVDAIAEYSAANGVSIDGLNIKDSKLNTNNSVVASNITDSAVTPAKLFTGTGSTWVWQTYSPSWTNVTVGNGTVAAFYTQIGKTVLYKISLTFGGTTSITGNARVSIPITSVTYPLYSTLGTGAMNDGGGAARPIYHNWATTTSAEIFYTSNSTTFGFVTSTTPATWTNGDILFLSGSYEAA